MEGYQLTPEDILAAVKAAAWLALAIAALLLLGADPVARWLTAPAAPIEHRP